MMEKTRIPSGSSLFLPTGKRVRRESRRQLTSLFVVQTITVQRRSRAESVSDAISERDEEKNTATTLAARRAMLANTLT